MEGFFRIKFRIAVSIFVLILFSSLSQEAFATTDTYTSGLSLWQAPPGVTSVSVEVWGGGGGGGGNTANAGGGGGGGGGAYSIKTVSVTPGNSYSVSVGDGGAGGVTNGTAGEDSWFSSTGTVLAKGGSGATDLTGGSGGAAGSGVGDTKYSGGSGGSTCSFCISAGAGGGSSAGTGSNGNNGGSTNTSTAGAGGTAPTGGAAGGTGGNPADSPSAPSNGSNYGGGGGGRGYNGSSTGNGAGGKVTLTYTVSDTTAPTITNVSSDTANGTYATGAVIDIDVTFSEAVTSTGNVTVTLETGATDRTCTFTVSNSTTGTCNYAVQSGDSSSDLTVSSISGTIADGSSNAMSNFTPATNLAANKDIVIEAVAPTLSKFTSTTEDGTYGPGSSINVTATYSEDLGSSSTITVKLSNGKNVTLTNIASADKTKIYGSYSVGSTGSPESSSDLTVQSIVTESILDLSGNTRTNSGLPDSPYNIGDTSDIVIDTTAPTVVSFSPPDNNTDVDGDDNFVITFSQAVTVGSGTITIRRASSAGVVVSVNVTSSEVTGSGTTTITINPTTNLPASTAYYVNIPTTAFHDEANNYYAGIGDKVTWNFTTNARPVILTFLPADNATNVAVNTNLVLTFNTPVFISSGNILVKRSSTNATLLTIPVTSAQVSGSGFATITINPTNDLPDSTGLYVQVPATAFRNAAGVFYSGISDTTTWNFTTSLNPVLTSVSPVDNASSVDVDENLVATFSKAVFARGGNVIIRRTSNNTTIASISVSSSQVSGSGTNTITINPSFSLPDSTGMYVQIPSTAFDDGAGHFYAGISDTTSWNFTTNSKPGVVSFAPADNATNVSVTANLGIVFNKPVFINAGSIAIRRLSDNITVETIVAPSSRITGSGTTTIAIDPINNFAYGTGYYIQMTGNVFRDSLNNYYPGIQDNSTWNFKTVNDIPQLISVSPPDNATGVAGNTDLVMTFSKAVTAGSGSIIVYRTVDNAVLANVGASSGFVTGGGTPTITVDVLDDLPEGTNVYVQIDSDAFLDSIGNYFPGISTKTGWNFSTTLAPYVISLSPENGASNVVTRTPLLIQFNKIVQIGTGAVTIYRTDNDNDPIESIDVASESVHGAGTDTITLLPLNQLPANTSLYVLVPGTAFHDGGGNYYSGISSATRWRFATRDNPTVDDPFATPSPTPDISPTPDPCPWWNIFCEDPTPTPTPPIDDLVSPTPSPTPEIDFIASIEDGIEKIIEVVKEVIDIVKEIITNPAVGIPRAREAMRPIVESKEVKTATTVATAAAIASVAASAGAYTTTIPTLATQLPQVLARAWQGLLSIFGFRKKKRPWGRVVDADSGDPIVGAYVQVFDHQTKQLKNTMVTNERGAFSSIVPAGMYDFRVHKLGWIITPTAPFLHLLVGEHVFDGRPVTVTQTTLLPIVIAMRLAQEIPPRARMVMRRIVQIVELFLARLSWPLLIVGLILNSAAVFVEPYVLNIVVEIIYGLLIVSKIHLHFALLPSTGYVRDGKTGKTLDLAFVRLYDALTGRLIESRTTGGDGKFLFLPSPGVYTISVVRAGYEPYRESHVVVDPKSEALAFSFDLVPSG